MSEVESKTKRSLRIRFSLRTLLFVIVLCAILLFFYMPRVKIRQATQRIEAMGGTVILACYEPEVKEYTLQLFDPYNCQDQYRLAQNQIDSIFFTQKSTEKPKNWLSLFRTNDLNVFAVSISAVLVDKDTVLLLKQLGGIEVVLLLVDENYLKALASTSKGFENIRKADLQRFGEKDIQRAISLIQEEIPNVAVYLGPSR